jgi:hypothetical protein
MQVFNIDHRREYDVPGTRDTANFTITQTRVAAASLTSTVPSAATNANAGFIVYLIDIVNSVSSAVGFADRACLTTVLAEPARVGYFRKGAVAGCLTSLNRQRHPSYRFLALQPPFRNLQSAKSSEIAQCLNATARSTG